MKTNPKRQQVNTSQNQIGRRSGEGYQAVPCAIYARSASEDPSDNMADSSVVLQQRHCMEAIWSQRARGWNHEATFVDKNRAGTAINPGLRRLLALVTAGEIKVVVVHRRDRFARRIELLNCVQNLCERHGVVIYYCGEGDCRSDTPLQRFRAALEALTQPGSAGV